MQYSLGGARRKGCPDIPQPVKALFVAGQMGIVADLTVGCPARWDGPGRP